jgi:hypothetical protein
LALVINGKVIKKRLSWVKAILCTISLFSSVLFFILVVSTPFSILQVIIGFLFLIAYTLVYSWAYSIKLRDNLKRFTLDNIVYMVALQFALRVLSVLV